MAKGKKTVKQKESAGNEKRPKSTENPQSYYGQYPVWSFRKLDDGYTKWGFSHTNELFRSVISKLKDYEGMTWNEILKASGGRDRKSVV